MTTWPNRLLRQLFGPTLRSLFPVENPEYDVGAETFNSLFWQLAGTNLVVHRVYLEASWNGSSFDIDSQAEAWNPNGDVAHPVLARASAGVYSYTFAATYQDMDGNAVQTVLGAPRVKSHRVLTGFPDRIEAEAWVDPSAPLVVEVRLWEADGTPVDHPFSLEVH